MQLDKLGAQPLAATGAAAGKNLAATHGGHAGTEAMAALADKLGGLIGTLLWHNSDSKHLPKPLELLP
jgi:hypothetical protein